MGVSGYNCVVAQRAMRTRDGAGSVAIEELLVHCPLEI